MEQDNKNNIRPLLYLLLAFAVAKLLYEIVCAVTGREWLAL